MELYRQPSPTDELKDKALQEAVQKHIGMSIWSFVSTKHSTYHYRRGRKWWEDGKYKLELSPMYVTIEKL